MYYELQNVASEPINGTQ